MDKNYHLKESRKFHKENSCYVHTEMMDGKAPMTVLCGDFLAMLHCVNVELNRIGEITKTSYKEAWELARIIHETGYKEVRENLYDNDSPIKQVKGTDFEEEIRKNIESEYEKRIDFEKANLKAEVNKLQKENISMAIQMAAVKEYAEQRVKAKEKQIKKLTKELKDLEHRFDEVWKKAKGDVSE